MSEFGPTELLRDEPPRRRVPRKILLGAVTALVVATGAGVAAAATASSPTPSPASPTPSPTPSVTEGDATPTPAPPPGKGWKRMMRGPFGAIHGEFVVPDGNGGYQTVATQIGEVTEVGEDSVTVRSEDGFSRTYAVGDSTRVSAGRQGVTGIESGDTVAVTAEVEGQTATATSVVDLTRPQHPRWYGGHGRDFPGKPFPGREGDPAPPEASPAPTG
ncbi:hypothetical protein [Planobispora longispora]|uniref:DUF5666 domain-containing protein n=1 Tax=Planobispora longispora TaxID=28887 RepID=A0A8J3RSL2_9ACTN|nr:hypothetical protein [Planobispora longispora]GIH79960.1 hypothetical protein Plo01_63890 [Planobispora longispora]